MKNIKYATTEQFQTIKNTLELLGYKKTSDCYWAQIFTSNDGKEIITERA